MIGRTGIIAILCLFVGSHLLAQDNTGFRAYFTFDAETTQLGQPVSLTATFESPTETEIEAWPDLSEETWLQVVDIGDPTFETINDQFVYTQDFDVVFWELGNYLTPEVTITTSGGSFDVQSDFITIQSVVGDAENLTPRPSRQPIDLPVTPRWVVPVVVATVSVLILLLLRFIQIGRRQIGGLVRGTPAQVAIAYLEDLKQHSQATDILYPATVNQVRQYLQQRFGIPAIEMTSTELLQLLREQNQLSNDSRFGLQQMLEQADLVKFARMTPDSSNSSQFINFAIRWIRSVERTGASNE